MTLDLAGRRDLLRHALQSSDPADYSGFAAAVAGADPDDRTSLARTLPPSRLFRDEGPTPRAAFVVTALGKPTLAVDTIAPFDLSLKKRYDLHRPAMVAPVLAAATDRDEAWQTEFVDQLADRGGWWGKELAWPVCHTLVHEHELPPSLPYLDLFIRELVGDNQGDPPAELGDRIKRRLLAEHLVDHEFWGLFRVEGCGAHYLLTDFCAEAWNLAIRTLCDELPDFRQRLLDESLRALLRDFSAKNILWYHRIHRLVDPTLDEVAARQPDYLAVLATAPSTAVGLAQDMLVRAAGRLDPSALLDASAIVLGRTEKKLVKGQLGLLSKLVKADPSQADAVSDLMAEVMDGLPLDLASIAGRLVTSGGDPSRLALRATSGIGGGSPTASGIGGGSVLRTSGISGGNPTASGVGVAVSVPGPRVRPLPAPPPAPPIADETELFELIAAHFEGQGDGADLPRIGAFLAGRTITLSTALRRRAQAALGASDPLDGSPRRHLAALVLHQAGEPVEQPEFRGFLRFEVFTEDEIVPPEFTIETSTGTTSSVDASGELQVIDEWTMRFGHRFISTQAPMNLLPKALRSGEPDAPLPATSRTWRRVVGTPGPGRWGHRDTPGPAPMWVSEPLTEVSAFHRQLTDVRPIEAEYTLRVEAARSQPGYDQIVEWAAWLLQNDPNTLAALEHPVLRATWEYPNLPGIGPLLAALGATRQVPGGPVYSALALAASAKTPEPRVQAAEAIAALCDSGLLDPAGFAQELAAHLADGFVITGRVAPTLADAASISALAGYRMLQTLAALLPHLDGVNQAGKLVELTARLATDYGTPVAIPESLAAKRKGNSVMAVALRTLASVQPGPTSLAQQAAEQAQAAREEPPQ
ncbi:MAG: DUF6493 family protein [Propionicimonas sp.]